MINVNAKKILLELAEGLKDALAPARCIDCLCEGTWYCSSCRRHTSPHIFQCIGCKSENMSGRTCTDCAEDTPLTGFISARPYTDHSIQRGIEWLKFKGIRPLAEVLAGLLIPKLTAIAPIDVLAKRAILVPLPLHKKRYLQRGFNQSEDIARAIGTLCSIEVRNLLTRITATASQAHLPHELRTQNMHDTFALDISQDTYQELTKNKSIIIILDDVSTTGATLISAAHAFPILADTEIWGAAIARG